MNRNMLLMLPAPTLDEGDEENANACTFKASPSGEESRGSVEVCPIYQCIISAS